MGILLVEQYFEFARNLCDSFAVMDRGQIVPAAAKADMAEHDVRRHLPV
jgi:urea transport system ATP-binding protein